jgi:hypothetical protein
MFRRVRIVVTVALAGLLLGLALPAGAAAAPAPPPSSAQSPSAGTFPDVVAPIVRDIEKVCVKFLSSPEIKAKLARSKTAIDAGFEKLENINGAPDAVSLVHLALDTALDSDPKDVCDVEKLYQLLKGGETDLKAQTQELKDFYTKNKQAIDPILANLFSELANVWRSPSQSGDLVR